jgi:hypothetical protein
MTHAENSMGQWLKRTEELPGFVTLDPETQQSLGELGKTISKLSSCPVWKPVRVFSALSSSNGLDWKPR